MICAMYFAVLCVVFTHASTSTAGNDDCVKVPPMCHNYTEMRLPNMLNHSRYEDVASDIGIWQPLLNSSKCNANNQLKYFLCFTYAPVCMPDKLVLPCKSFCETVRDSCDPVMQRYNYSWPTFFNCKQKKKFRDDSSQMCINLTMLGINLPMLGTKSPKKKKCSCQRSYGRKTLKLVVCQSDFVFSGWVTAKHIKQGEIDVKSRRIFKQTSMIANMLKPQLNLKLHVSNDKTPCHCTKLRVKKKPRGSGRYLIIGSKVGGKMQVDAITAMKTPRDVVKMVKQCT